MTNEDIIIEPVLSEKATALREEGKYVFRVCPFANKMQIKDAVSRLFGVKVVGCTTICVNGKQKRMRNRLGRTPAWKKAVVKLEKGQNIKVFEGV